MSIVQPENGLPERRMITADSFRALKLKLINGTRQAAEPAVRRLVQPMTPASVEAPPPIIITESNETSPEPVEEIAPPQAAESAEPFVDPLPDPAPELAVTAITDEPLFHEAQGDDVQPADNAAELVRLFGTTTSSPAADPDELPAEKAQAVEENLSTEEPPVETAEAAEDNLSPDEPPKVEPSPVAHGEQVTASVAVNPPQTGFIERRVLEQPQPEDAEAGERANALLDIMAIPTEGSLPQERALANDTLLRLIPRMPLKSLRHLADRVCLMEAPSQLLVRRLINDPRIEVSGPLLENAMTVNDSDLIAVANGHNPAKLKLIARRRIISPAVAEALIQSNHVETLINLVRNPGASFSIESMWRLTRFAAAHPVLQAPLVTRQDTPSPIAFQLFWRLPSELRRYVLSRFLTDSETITKILTMNRENDEGTDRKYADLSLLSKLEDAPPEEAGEIFSRLTHVSEETGARIADDAGGEALTVALKAAGLTRAQFASIVEKRPDAEALKAIFETLSFNKARVLLTYWDWAAKRTGPYARTAAS